MAEGDTPKRKKAPFFSVRRKWKTLEYATWTVASVLAVLVAALPLGMARGHSVSWLVGYSWVLAFVLLLQAALFIPLRVRRLGVRLLTMPNLFRKQITLYISVVLIPGLLMSLFILAAAVAQEMGIQWLVSIWALVGLVVSVLALTVWAICFAVWDFNHRVNDALLVITNGMELAAKLDFDAPIIAPSQDEIGLVSEIFNQVTRMLKTRVYVLQALFNNVRIFSGLLDEERLLNHTLKTFKNLEKVDEIVIALRDDANGEMYIRKISSERPEIVGLRFAAGEGVLGRLLKNPELTVYSGEEYEEAFRKDPKEKKLWGKPDSVMAVPLAYKGMLTGGIIFYNMDFVDQLDMKKDYIQGLSNQIAIFLENARLYQMVIRDRLTGLFVHNFIEAELENLLAQARRYKFPVSFLMFDVDKFKGINDQYGHPVGNQLLVAIAQAMRSVSRDADLPARYGGDEFEIVLPHTDKDGGKVYAEKLRKAVADIRLEVAPGTEVHVTISVGLATYPDDAPAADKLQQAADNALYGAKALGRNCIVLYQTPAEAPK
ncbi:MAG TPA: diguanylate cyclase [bacterium]|nr:diguanylate cyclase [bacterium]